MSATPAAASVGAVIDALLVTDAKTATKYVSPDLTIKATVIGRRPRKRDQRVYLNVTIGKPNYRERAFVAQCRKAGEPFPVKKIQLRAFPAKGKAKR